LKLKNVIKVEFKVKRQDLVLLHSDDHDGAVLTRDAYVQVLKTMEYADNACHTATPIDAESASIYLNGDIKRVITLEDLTG
jgi:hypothetical protein